MRRDVWREGGGGVWVALRRFYGRGTGSFGLLEPYWEV